MSERERETVRNQIEMDSEGTADVGDVMCVSKKKKKEIQSWPMFSIVVCLHVSMEVPGLRESKVADLAAIWLLPTMNTLMFSES